MNERSPTPPMQALPFPGRMNLRAKLILGFSLIAGITSLVTALAIYTSAQRQLFENFRRRVLTAVAITALQQKGDEFETITSASDPLYEEYRLKNLKILRSDPDFIFVYTMRKDSEGIYFVVDGNELDAEGFSAYGDRYLEPSPYLVENFDSMTQPIVEPEIYTDEFGSFLSAYAPILTSDGRQVGVVAVDIAADNIVQEERRILFQSIVIFLVVLLLGILLGYPAGNALARPLARLAEGTRAFASGNFGERVAVETKDEIGDLANTFNGMAGEIQGLIGGLEERVSQRTGDLETARLNSERRAFELQTIGEISKVITSEQNLAALLPLITRLVSERFGFYHVGIFLLDEARQFAVLQAANSEGGQKMLARGHSLEVGTTGIVGYVAKTGAPRIALDVGTDAVFFNNPDLPNTRSEMALPLISRRQTIGVLDAQSNESGAFTEDDARILRILADQIAVAIENARLFEETRRSLNEANLVYRRSLREGWSSYARSQHMASIRQAGNRATILTEPLELPGIEEVTRSGEAYVKAGRNTDLTVPVKLRGEIVGFLSVRASEGREWTRDDLDIVTAIAERAALSVENSRLLQDAQKRAAKERTIGEISARIGNLVDLDNILQTTIQELSRNMPDAEVAIQFHRKQG
jgi:GAF domain-containing protein/HAMP domain-containing protein